MADEPPYNPFDDLPGFFREMRKITVKLVTRLGGNKADISDVDQDAKMHLFCNGPISFNNRTHFFGAVQITVLQCSIDWKRKNRRHEGNVPIDEQAEIRAVKALSATTDAALRETFDELAKDEDAAPWIRVLGEFYFEGRPEADIAHDMKVSLATVQRYKAEGLMAVGARLGIAPRIKRSKK